jgi:hypothetical protein
MLLAQAETWGDKLRNGFEGFFDFIPNLVACLAVLVIGYIVARLVAAAIARLLDRAGLDRTLTRGQGGRYLAKATESPSRLLSRIAFWVIMLAVLALAASVLGIAEITAVVGAILAYIPNVIAALLIFLVAGAIATGLSALINRTLGDTPTGRVLSTVAPGLVMAIAVFMILNQLRIAPTIVTITYAALIGSLALASALAFGLGGRDVASRMLEDAYAKGHEAREQARRDYAYGRARRGATTRDVDGMTLAELQEEARELEVPGRSDMNKDDLANAVDRARARTTHEVEWSDERPSGEPRGYGDRNP